MAGRVVQWAPVTAGNVQGSHMKHLDEALHTSENGTAVREVSDETHTKTPATL